MGRVYAEITPPLRQWIERQQLFFVGTAPLSGEAHINVSPKGPIGTLSVLGPHEVAYLDVVGSGAETVAHLRENGRIIVMLCAFQGPPRILRLHGSGEVILAHESRFAALFERCDFAAVRPETRRAIIRIDVTRVSDSCGYGVPLMSYQRERPHQDAWAEKKLRVGGPNALRDYQVDKNAVSVDGLPGVDVPT